MRFTRASRNRIETAMNSTNALYFDFDETRLDAFTHRANANGEK
jgi:hypothetical protein